MSKPSVIRFNPKTNTATLPEANPALQVLAAACGWKVKTAKPKRKRRAD